MYEILSENYDRFVNWQNRLKIELPFILQNLNTAGVTRVLDAATGTGMHAIALAKEGYSAAGADLSPGMIDRARRNAKSAGVNVRFEVAGFGSLADTFGRQSFEAMLCLGNSLPHLLSHAELVSALHDFAACLQPGGVLLIQNRNFDAVVANRQRWMEPQSYAEAGEEGIFQRFYDFDPDGLLTFNMVILKRHGNAPWSQEVVSSRLRPILKDELLLSLAEAGFIQALAFGDMSGADFEPEHSSNLVVSCIKRA